MAGMQADFPTLRDLMLSPARRTEADAQRAELEPLRAAMTRHREPELPATIYEQGWLRFPAWRGVDEVGWMFTAEGLTIAAGVGADAQERTFSWGDLDAIRRQVDADLSQPSLEEIIDRG